MKIKLKLVNARKLLKERNFENALKVYSCILDEYSNHQESKKQIKKILFLTKNIISKDSLEGKDINFLEETKIQKKYFTLYFFTKQLIKKFPNEFILYNYLSYAEININKNEQALISIEKSLELNSKNYQTNFQYVNILFSLGLFTKAEKYLKILSRVLK